MVGAMPVTAAQATGRRKTSVARLWLRPGHGKFLVNDHPAEKYFGGHHRQRLDALSPLKEAKLESQYDIHALVEGGGVTGQAGALRHALARAVATLGEPLQKLMRQHGFLTRDSRMVERKKYGQPKARKRFQFSKR